MKLEKVHRVAAALAAAVNEADQGDATVGQLLERCAANAVAVIRADLTGSEADELDRVLSGTTGRLHAVAVTGWLNGYEQAATITAAQETFALLARAAQASLTAPEPQELPGGVYL